MPRAAWLTSTIGSYCSYNVGILERRRRRIKEAGELLLFCKNIFSRNFAFFAWRKKVFRRVATLFKKHNIFSLENAEKEEDPSFAEG